MSRGSAEKVLEDKFASKAIHFGDDQNKTSFKDDEALKDMKGFSSVSRQITEEKEKEKKPDGLLARKMKRIFGAAGQAQGLFLQGFKMGFIVGGIFGGLTGLYYAFQTKSILVVPMVALSSGASFGFFMGVGMIMRNEMEGSNTQ